MSDDQKTPESPAPVPAGDSAPPVAPASTASTPAQPGTDPSSVLPPPSSAPTPAPIEYALPAPKTSLPTPALVKNLGCLFKLMFGFTILLCAGYFALVALNPKARQWATQGGKDGSGGPTPFKALNLILAIPAQAIGKTKDVVAASDARTGIVNKVVAEEEAKTKETKTSRPLTDIFSKPAAEPGKPAAAGDKEADDNSVSRQRLLALAEKSAAEDGPAKPAAVAPVPVAAPPPPPGPAEMKLGGGITVTNQTATTATPASAPFMYWVAGLGVSGVSTTSPARFLMNGRLVQEGDEVNRSLGVTFDHLDGAAKLIYFRDKNGAVVTRSY